MQIVKYSKILSVALLLLICNSAFGQSSWIKQIPNQGQLAAVTFIKNDTLYSFGSNFINPVKRPTEVYVSKSLLDGTFICSDTIDFAKIINDSNAYFIVLFPNQVLFDSKTNQFEMGQGSLDTFRGGYKIRNSILTYPDKTKLAEVYNYDTLINELYSYKIINNKKYGVNIVFYENSIGKTTVVETYIAAYDQDSFAKIFKHSYPFNIANSVHFYVNRDVYEDKQNGANLFVYKEELWNEYENIQDHIVKLDTFGNVLWDFRLNENDSTNTSYTQIAQKPNGNILAFWSDWKYGAFQPQNPGMLSQSSNWGCLIMAEIDYQTGKVLLRKSLRNILISKMERLDKEPSRNFTSNLQDKSIHRELKYVTYTNDGIVLAGDFNTTNKAYDRVPFVEPYINNKMFPFLLKIDFNGNVVWYREIDVYQNDSTCTGMKVKHITLMPDSGFLLGGSIQFKDSFSQNTPYAALLKLDKNGCFEQGCDKFDAVERAGREAEGLLVYPNPAKDEVTLQANTTFHKAEVLVYDISGKELERIAWLGNQELKLNTSQWNSGVYIILVQQDGKTPLWQKVEIE